MFRHQMCHPQGACFVTLLNYISTIAAELQLYLCNLARQKSKLPEGDIFGVDTGRRLIIFIYLL